MGIPVKLKYIQKFWGFIDYPLLKLPLPNINPNILSSLSLVASLIFILTLRYFSILAFIFIIISLLFDWLDGLITKKYYLESEEGYIIDVTSDRLSEAIMFTSFFMPWFYLFVLNSILTVFSFTRNHHIIMPLRAIFLVYFFFAFII